MSTKTSSRQIKLHKKVKIGTGRSKSPKDDGEPLDSKKKGFRRNKNAEVSINDAADILYHDNKLYKKENGGRMNLTSKTQNKFVYGEILDSKKKGFRRNNNAEVSIDAAADILYHDKKLYKKENGGRMNVKSKTQNKFVYEQKNEGGMGSKPINYDRKLKRVYGDKIKEGMFHRNAETPNRRVLSKGLNELNHDMAKEKHILRGRSHGFEQLEKERLFKGERKPCETMSLDNNGHRKLRPRLKAVAKMESVKMNPSGSGSMMKGAKKKSDSRKKLDQYHNGCAAEFIGKSAKKRICDKKSPSDDLEENGRPKKKKRTIQLDPRDITNKRLDDGVVTIGHTQEKKEVTEKNERAEMSKNAQFRAINPSPSILSFVEDNFLGRRRLIDLRRAGYNTELSAPLDNIPFSTSSERERIEESIFRNKLTFFAAANVSSSFPPPDLPEIAFAGRSNVGKSSLLNALTRQWGVVRTSDKPGLTQTINFFTLGSKLCLVDLPGYGFAYAKEDVKEAWEELVKEYISTRVGLKRVCLLIDTKWGMKPRDHELIDLMERSHTKYQIVLTKTDLVFPIDVARRAMQIEESLKAKKSAVPPVMMASSKSGAGIRSLRTVLSKIARFAKL